MSDLPEHVRRFLAPPRFATLATVDPDGSPRTAVVWYGLEADDSIILNSAEGRRWPANLRRDPRLSLAVIDETDGYRWVGMSGEVSTVVDEQDRAQADIAALAYRYHVDDPDEARALIARRFTKQHRISFLVRPTEIHDHLE
jgi:PPOX class probable F420-dependent enzyme